MQAVVIMAGLSFVFFFIVHLAPGGPCTGLFQNKSQAVQARICRIRLGLDQPLPVQYFKWLANYVHGNFGQQQNGYPVLSAITDALPVTILLATVSYTIQQLIALPLGMLSALRQYSFFDTFFTFLSYVGLSMPTFWLGLMLIFFFGIHLGWFPVAFVVNPQYPNFMSNAWLSDVGHNPALYLGDLIRHLVLPAVTLMVVGIGADSRFMRASMLDVIHQDYIRTARAKGLSRSAVIFKHALRNAILPIVTNIALYLPTLVGGFIITETLFSYAGVGYLFITSIQFTDYGTVQALLMLSAVAVLLANLLADIAYAWVDPRIRYD